MVSLIEYKRGDGVCVNYYAILLFYDLTITSRSKIPFFFFVAYSYHVLSDDWNFSFHRPVGFFPLQTRIKTQNNFLRFPIVELTRARKILGRFPPMPRQTPCVIFASQCKLFLTFKKPIRIWSSRVDEYSDVKSCRLNHLND